MKYLIIMLIFLCSCMRSDPSYNRYELPRDSFKRSPPQATVPSISKFDSIKTSGNKLYQIYCQICHAKDGSGRHHLHKYGMPYPPNFNSEKFTHASSKYFIQIMQNGKGSMASFASRLTPEQMKRIARYIKEVQVIENKK